MNRILSLFTATSILLLFTQYTSAAFDDQLVFSEKQVDAINSYQSDHYYQGTKGTKNYYSKFTFNQGSIDHPLVIVTGIEDPAPFWYEVALLARDKGFKEIFIVDLRGQGQSERVWEGEKKLIFVEEFNDYVLDLSLFFESILGVKKEIHPYIISHSTGSIVTSELLKLPNIKIKPVKMSFWTPLFRLNINSLLENSIINKLIGFVDRASLFLDIPIVVKKYKKVSFKKNRLTTDEAKHLFSENLRFNKNLGSYGVSLHWVLEVIKVYPRFRRYIEESLVIDTLILKASDDVVVDNDYNIENEKVTIKVIKGAKHALNVEINSILREAFETTMGFFFEE